MGYTNSRRAPRVDPGPDSRDTQALEPGHLLAPALVWLSANRGIGRDEPSPDSTVKVIWKLACGRSILLFQERVCAGSRGAAHG